MQNIKKFRKRKSREGLIENLERDQREMQKKEIQENAERTGARSVGRRPLRSLLAGATTTTRPSRAKILQTRPLLQNTIPAPIEIQKYTRNTNAITICLKDAITTSPAPDIPEVAALKCNIP